MPLRKLGSLIANADALGSIRAQTRRLQGYDKLFGEIAPAGVRVSSRVKAFRDGTLIIMADKAPAAAKLRQMAPRLLAALQSEAPEIRSIKFEMQVIGSAGHEPRRRNAPDLSPDAVRRFEGLADTVEGPLKGALEALVRRRRP